LRNRGREHQTPEHQQEQQDADRRQFGVEPVGDPGGVDPHPPHRQKQQRRLRKAKRREPAQQRVRYLRDRENEYQIEKQFGIGDAAVLVRRDLSIKRTAFAINRHARVPACPS
jgi:hypothetical protein